MTKRVVAQIHLGHLCVVTECPKAICTMRCLLTRCEMHFLLILVVRITANYLGNDPQNLVSLFQNQSRQFRNKKEECSLERRDEYGELTKDLSRRVGKVLPKLGVGYGVNWTLLRWVELDIDKRIIIS